MGETLVKFFFVGLWTEPWTQSINLSAANLLLIKIVKVVRS